MLGSSGVLRWSLSWITRAPLAPAACTGPPADGAAGGQPLCSAPPESSAPGPSVAPFIENGCTSQKLRSRAGEKRGRRGSGARSIPSSTCWSDSGARGVECVGERELGARRDPHAGRPRLLERTRSEGLLQPNARAGSRRKASARSDSHEQTRLLVVCGDVKEGVVGWGVSALERRCLRAGARAYFGPRPGVGSRAGDMMFDGVIPLGVSVAAARSF